MAAGDEITELQAVDISLGGVFAAAYDGLGATGPENYKRFCTRPIAEKIFRTQVDSPDELVRKIAASKKGQGRSSTPPTPGEHLPDLPVIAYFRKPGMTNGDDFTRISEKVMYDEALEKQFRLTFCPVALDYSIIMAAWDKPTLDKLQIGWYAHTVKNCRKGARFVVPYLLDGSPFEIPAWVTTPRSVLFTDSSLPTSEGRLYAVSAGLTVNTFVLVGQAVTIPPFEVWGIARNYVLHGPKDPNQGA